MKNKTYNKRKILIVFIGASLMILGLIARLCYLMIFDAEYYQKKAEALHEREREIKAARGEIIDRNGKKDYPLKSKAEVAADIVDNLAEVMKCE